MLHQKERLAKVFYETFLECFLLISVSRTSIKKNMMGQSSPFNPLTFLFLRAFLQWQVVIGMEAEQIIESLANYIWFLRAPNAVCISHLLLIDRRTPLDLWRHNFAFLVTFNIQKLIFFVNSIKSIRAGAFLELTSETAICNNLTAKVSVKGIKWFAICASLKLTDLIS